MIQRHGRVLLLAGVALLAVAAGWHLGNSDQAGSTAAKPMVAAAARVSPSTVTARDTRSAPAGAPTVDLTEQELERLLRTSRQFKVQDAFAVLAPPPPPIVVARAPKPPAQPAPASVTPPPTVVIPASPPAPPIAPPLPYRFVGKMVEAGQVRVFVAQGDEPRTLKAPGELLDNQYRVEALSESGLTLLHLPTQTRQSLAFGPSRP